MKASIPAHTGLTPTGIIQGLGMAIAKTPYLLKCDSNTLIEAALAAARIGLPLDPSLGLAYIVPRKEKGALKASMDISYRGLIMLMRRAGAIDYVEAQVVYSKDGWEIKGGFPPTPYHKPYTGPGDRGDMVAVYAVAYKDEKVVGRIWMDRAAVEKRRNHSESKNSDYSPWNNWPGEMWKKTCIRQLAKTMPLSIEVVRAIELDKAQEVNLRVISGSSDYSQFDAIAIENKQDDGGVDAANEAIKKEQAKTKTTTTGAATSDMGFNLTEEG